MWRVLLVLCVACSNPALPDGISRFDGSEVQPTTDDLAPLWALVGNARVVGLGESVHTSGGFNATKERLIRAMIEQRNVRVIAFESPRNRVRALDTYVTSGTCDLPARQLFGISLFEVFVDDHTYALLRWVCERNARSPDDPVHIFGFDVQQSDEDGPEIAQFLAGTDAPADRISTCFVASLDEYTASQHTTCLAGLSQLATWLEAHRATLLDTRGARAVATFEIAFASFRAEQDHYFLLQTDQLASNEPRDRGMAEVFRRLRALDYPDARIAIWAHNFHLSRHHDRVEDSYYAPPFMTTFGTVLDQLYGDDYAPIALTGYAPGTNWPQVDLATERTSYGTGSGSVERKCHLLDEPFLIVDPHAAYLAPERPQPLNEEISIPHASFAGIVYLDNSPPMDAVFW